MHPSEGVSKHEVSDAPHMPRGDDIGIGIGTDLERSGKTSSAPPGLGVGARRCGAVRRRFLASALEAWKE